MTATRRSIASPSPTSPARGGWDSEVFILDGPDRSGLCGKARALANYLFAHASVDLPTLASTLAHGLGDGEARLSIVAPTLEDLQKKLTRVIDRLEDPECKQIRDAAGIYFFEQPLYVPGNLALLFPGEGAQYPGMMADLCEPFPEADEIFALCDHRASTDDPSNRTLRQIIHPPLDASEGEKAAAEKELRKLGPSIFGVLVGDLVIDRVLQNLEVPVSAVAGHSAGELAALVAAGAIPANANFAGRMAAIQEIMQRQEAGSSGADVALVAVGAGSDVVREIAASVAGGAVIVAMDNCPHQCVAVGPTHLVGLVETSLRERGLFCERLPFNRAYHTPMFEPWMAPFRTFFDDIPFAPPHIPVYSGSTGRRFPDEPNAIRRLAVDHWVSPVEFTKLIETMHADGIRLFVEAGPRGNLSSFVEDILRGKPFAALPANTSRRSGPSQINHLVAQLAALHVPLNLEHLYSRRVTESIENLFQLPNRITEQIATSAVSSVPFANIEEISDSASARVMESYLETMGHFLDLQRDVMTAFLNGRPPEETNASGEIARVFAAEFADEPPSAAIREYALLGHIEHFVPGRELIARRILDESEDLYSDHHTLGGRGVSRSDPGQNGLPVMPMTFSLEAMTEAAATLFADKVVVAVRNVRLSRWLPFDTNPTTLEVRATFASLDPESGQVEVRADIRDLGNTFVPDGANKVASEAVIVLADGYPETPAVTDFHLTSATPCRVTVEELRRNMFHGPIFQMIRTLDRTGLEGIEGTLEVQPREGWFRSNPNPDLVFEPALLDAAMHIFGAWHLEQPDWTGRILLPFEVARIDFYGPPPAIGTTCVIRGHNEQESARHFRHGLDIISSDGRPWLRMTGAGYWRFYLPFGHVNFFGPKDEYFLSSDWPEACASATGSTVLNRCYFLEPPVDLKQPVLRAAAARVTMTPREIAEFQAWSGTDSELSDWFFGHMLAKDAVRAVWREKHGVSMYPADIEIESSGEGRLVAVPREQSGSEPFPPVAVASCDGKVAAFSAFAERVGLALMSVPKGKSATSAAETASVNAVADALRTTSDGLTATLDATTGQAIVELSPAVTARFPRLSNRLIARTARRKDLVVATTTCEDCQ